MAVAVAAGAGCGDNAESTAKDEPANAGAANEPADAFVKRMVKLLETTTKPEGCTELTEINGRSVTRLDCPPTPELRKSMTKFELLGAEEHGTGAVIDYRSGQVEESGAIVLTVSPDRQWALNRMGLLTDPSVGTDDRDSRAGYLKATESYLEAVRERDCDAYAKIAFVGKKSKREICKVDFRSTAGLAKRLDANPDAQLRYEGGNGTFGFYSLETSKPKPKSVTISLAKAAETSDTPFVVLDLTASPTAAQRTSTGDSGR